MADGGTQSLIAEVTAALDHLVPPGPLGVAVSGGSDSMALLALAHGLPGTSVRAVTVDHGLRPAALDEARMVGRFCAARGIAHDILTPEPVALGGNLQARARAARYGALAAWATEHGVAAIALGHTLDDQAETVLLRLARGAGADGLGGMAGRRDWAGIAWVRPLLDVRRQALRDWLSEAGIGWAEDPSNADDRFDRVKARRALAALSPLGITAESLAETARIARAQAVVLRERADALAARARRPGDGGVSLDRAALAAAPEDTALRVLARALQDVGGAPDRPRQRSLGPLLARLSGQGRFRATLAGCVVDTRAEPARAVIRPEPAASRTPRR